MHWGYLTTSIGDLSPHLISFLAQVCKTREGRVMTLEELFRSMNLTAYDLTVDMLDVHAVRESGAVMSVYDTIATNDCVHVTCNVSTLLTHL